MQEPVCDGTQLARHQANRLSQIQLQFGGFSSGLKLDTFVTQPVALIELARCIGRLVPQLSAPRGIAIRPFLRTAIPQQVPCGPVHDGGDICVPVSPAFIKQRRLLNQPYPQFLLQVTSLKVAEFCEAFEPYRSTLDDCP
ncbi:MAG: hypothetical protein WCO86_12160 [Planctomycetota bacterium]